MLLSINFLRSVSQQEKNIFFSFPLYVSLPVSWCEKSARLQADAAASFNKYFCHLTINSHYKKNDKAEFPVRTGRTDRQTNGCYHVHVCGKKTHRQISVRDASIETWIRGTAAETNTERNIQDAELVKIILLPTSRTTSTTPPPPKNASWHNTDKTSEKSSILSVKFFIWDKVWICSRVIFFFSTGWTCDAWKNKTKKKHTRSQEPAVEQTPDVYFM